MSVSKSHGGNKNIVEILSPGVDWPGKVFLHPKDDKHLYISTSRRVDQIVVDFWVTVSYTDLMEALEEVVGE